MDKKQLLELEAQAHLTPNELAKARSPLAPEITARLTDVVAGEAIARLAQGSEKLEKLAVSIALPQEAGNQRKLLGGLALKALRDAVKADAALAADAQVADHLKRIEEAATVRGPDADLTGKTLADAARLDEPLIMNPAITKDLEAARLFRLGDAAKLADKTVEAVIEEVGSIDAVTTDALRQMVDKGTLKQADASSVGLAASLYAVLDQRPELVAEVGRDVSAMPDLVRLSASEWESVVKASKTTPPGDLSVQDYAGLLRRKVAMLFPAEAIAARNAAVDVAAGVKANAALSDVRKRNPEVSLAAVPSLDGLELGNVSAAERDALEAGHAVAARLANSFSGMKIADLLDDRQLSDAELTGELSRRVDLATKFMGSNPGLLGRDLTVGSGEIEGVNFPAGVKAADKSMLLAHARTYQRVMSVADDLDDAAALVAAGYRSAYTIATSDVATLAKRAGIDAARAEAYFGRAKGIMIGVTGHLGMVVDGIASGAQNLPVGNAAPPIEGYLKEIPGFAEFFGNQDYCNCSHCQSILSPAAYFVDLMCFVEEQVTQPYFATRANHPLNLKVRRPDLWTTELTCDNTNQPIPYLVIVNEILENAVARESGFAGNLTDRTAVAQWVYRQTLPDAVNSFDQPLNLPFEEIVTYLRHFDLLPADIGEAGLVAGDDLARLRLSLSPEHHALIVTVQDGLAFLKQIYGIPFAEASGKIQPFDAGLLLKPMGISRTELEDLVKSRFVSANGTAPITIQGEKRSAQSIQNDIEKIRDLTRAALDRMHRFVRLRKATGWRIGELDLVLSHLSARGIGTGINAASVQAIGQLVRLQERLNVPVEELVALWSLVPVEPVLRQVPLGRGDGFPKPRASEARLATALFDRQFNQERYVASGGRYPQDATLFLHPGLAIAPPAQPDPNFARLMAGTGTGEGDLLLLIRSLAHALGVEPDSTVEARRKFPLTHRNLTLLYRHARIARLLKISIADLLGLCAVLPGSAFALVDSIDDLTELVEAQARLKASGRKPSDVVDTVQPFLPPYLRTAAPLAATTAGQAITCSARNAAGPTNTETITFAANATIAAVVADWNAKATHSRAYRADAAGMPDRNGGFLGLRGHRAQGASLTITADAANLFGSALPATSQARALSPMPLVPPTPSAGELAAALAQQVAATGRLVFADTVFSLLTPTPPRLIGNAAAAIAASGDSVTLVASINGVLQSEETIDLPGAADLDALIGDWNAKSASTLAYRADAAGRPDPAGAQLGLTTRLGAGSNTAITVSQDSADIFTTTTPMTVSGAEVTAAVSQAIVAANAARFQGLPDAGKYRLRADYDPATALTLPAGLPASLEPELRALLAPYHAAATLIALLPARIGCDAAALPHLAEMLAIDLADPALFGELRGDSIDQPNLAKVIDRLRRLDKVLGGATRMGSDNLAFIAGNVALFTPDGFGAVGLPTLLRLDLLRELTSSSQTDPETGGRVRTVLTAYATGSGFGAADLDVLAGMLGCSVGTTQALQTLPLATNALDAMAQLMRAAARITTIGASSSIFALVAATDADDLAAASAAIQAGIRSHYTTESEWEERVEPYNNTILSRRRDGLVAWLVHSGAPEFDEVTDLYHYFLLDCEVEGCMRTSRVAAAIDSVQLYVNRCQMNLEQSPPGAANSVHVLPSAIPADQWDWRRNYRVWEASRKIFLYPENYIEPELRDDKTPEFRALEDELLSKDMTDEAILDAFGRYLRSLDELSHLTIAGSYHEKDKDQRRDVLHLIGVTADDPPTYYYRRIEDAHFGAVASDRATHWGAWEKLNVQIPVRKASPVVHNGQLFLFWIRYVTKPENSVKDGASRFTGYQHKAYVEFTKRKIDGSWTSPQKLRLGENPFTSNSYPQSYQDDGVILDPIVPKAETSVEIAWFDINLYSDFEPLYDSVAHAVPKEDYAPRGFMWDQLYPASKTDLTLRGVNFQMWSPVDLYRLEIGEQIDELGPADEEGVPWLNPVAFLIVWLLSGGKFDLAALLPPRLVWSRRAGENRELHTAPSGLPCFDTYTYASILLDEDRIAHYEQRLAALNSDGSTSGGPWTRPQWSPVITDYLRSIQKPDRLGTIPGAATIDVVNGSVGDVIIQTSRDAFYMQADVRGDGKYHLRRLNTSLSEPIADILFRDGLEKLLSTSTQLGLAEAATGLTLSASKVHDATQTGTIDYDGAMGVYLREVFFHIPFLIADHLNSQGRYEDARRWYHFIFDPTSAETVTGIPAGISAEERRRRELDRNWRYREFRGLPRDSMRAQLTNGTAIEQYRRDPFNPHAIARVRKSAYQKAVVLKYADNLLDWGDDLFVKAFGQSNPEYLRDATLKYVIAQEILGGRPVELGDCGEGLPQPKTFATIKPQLAGDSEFLMEFESVIVTGGWRGYVTFDVSNFLSINAAQSSTVTTAILTSDPLPSASPTVTAAGSGKRKKVVTRKQITGASAQVRAKAAKLTRADITVSAAKGREASRPVTVKGYAESMLKHDWLYLPGWGQSVVRQFTPIFCVPGNDRIQSYWTRVEDRLFKLRHCQDINGTFRLLPLFAPAIDPALLVGGAASGLSLDDILAAAEGSVPPYRFRYLLDKARSYAATVQGFGAALLSALEKRDGEELTRLRNLHQKNLLMLTSEMKANELKIAEQGVEIVNRRLEGAQYRHDYYEKQLSTGLLPAEMVQQVSQVLSSTLRGGAMAVGIAAAISRLFPQVGSPFSMKYGGLEVGGSLGGWLTVASNAASITDAIATTAGIIASNERRVQGWEHQRDLAELDIKVIEKDLAIAELRRTIAQRSLELHDKSRDQHDEILEFYDAKFTNMALYVHMARSLQQLHREAYSNALAMARLAEQAYRFERPFENSFFVGGEWDASRAGLLAGERLTMALNAMDRRYTETNVRQAEINQTFSLSQIAPDVLVGLKQSGSCEFTLPEFYFDMFYPGQYRRRIKAVRLTIPCITGPYTNISARLTLLGSHIRNEAALGSDKLVEVPFSGTPSISTSTGQGDSGVFELNFRDERYMPFEGAGAISTWRLELPSNFRPFDYHSINDVLINVSYTADEDDLLRKAVETRNAAIEGTLASYLADNTATRVISLRQEFSSAFNRLAEAPSGTAVTIDLAERHFPMFLQGRSLQLSSATVVLDVMERVPVGDFTLEINGTAHTGFPAPTDPAMPDDALGGLPARSATAAFAAGMLGRHTLRLTKAGTVAMPAGSDGTIDPDKLRDILLVLEFGL